jgi:methylated-DNA-[protein]-cysteine S-methyltransferase
VGGRGVSVLAACATPVGRLTLVAGDAGLCRVLWPGEVPPPEARPGADPVLGTAAAQLEEYFAGARTAFDLPLDLAGTAFQRRAWLELAAIPYGTTRSYGAQARRLGRPRAARAVGAANARNPVPIVLPCHRLVGARGALTGFAGGLEVKRALLAHEARVAGAGAAGTSRTRTSPAPRPRT